MRLRDRRMRRFNIYLKWILKIIREYGGETIFKEIMADNFSRLMKGM